MRSIKPCGNEASSKQMALLFDQVDQLQKDLADLQAEVTGFGSSFNTASAAITKLDVGSIKATEGALFKDTVTIERGLTTTSIKALPSHQTFDQSTIELGSYTGNLDLEVLLVQNGKKQYIKLSNSKEVVIAQSSGDVVIDTIAISRKGDRHYINANIDAATEVYLFSLAEDFKAFDPKPVETEDAVYVDIGNKITLSGNININNAEKFTFRNVEITSAKFIENLNLNDKLDLVLKADPITGTNYTKIAMPDGILSFNNGDIKLTYHEGKVVAALLKGYTLSKGSDGYFYIDNIAHTEYTLTLDYMLAAPGVTFTAEPNIPGIPDIEVLCVDNEYIEDLIVKGLNVLDLLNANEITATLSTIGNLTVNEKTITNTLDVADTATTNKLIAKIGVEAAKISLTNKTTVPVLDNNDNFAITFYPTGVFALRIVKDDAVIATISGLRDANNILANHTISYTQRATNTIKKFSVDVDNNLVITLGKEASKATVFYGYIGTEEATEEATIATEYNRPTVDAITFDVVKLSHTLILGDGTANYGINVQGEVAADLIPLPGTTSYEDLSVSKTLTVGGKSTLNDLETQGKTNLQSETKIGKYNEDGSIKEAAPLFVSGKATVGSADKPADIEVTGNSELTGDVHSAGNLNVDGTGVIKGNTTIGTNETPATANITGDTTIGSDISNANLYVNGEAYEDSKRVACREDIMTDNTIAAWNEETQKLSTPNEMVEGFVHKAQTHEAINIKGLDLDINKLDKNADVFGNIYTGLGNDWTVQENLPEEARGSTGFCLEILPNSHNVIQVYTINKPSGAITWKRRFDNNTWSEWIKVVVNGDSVEFSGLTVNGVTTINDPRPDEYEWVEF